MADLYGADPAEGRTRAEQLPRLLDLDGDADRLIEGYSRGMRQKLGFCAALLHEPEVVFCHEPTSGLDPRSARAVKDILSGLAQRGRAVFVSTHILEVAQHMCHRVGIIDGGRLLAAGTLDELRGGREGASLEEIFLQLTGGPEVEELASFLSA